MLLIDVTPLSLGIETEGKNHSVIIPRNTSIPCTKESTYTTTENYQEAIDIRVFEGERPCTDGNHLLGEFKVDGSARLRFGARVWRAPWIPLRLLRRGALPLSLSRRARPESHRPLRLNLPF